MPQYPGEHPNLEPKLDAFFYVNVSTDQVLAQPGADKICRELGHVRNKEMKRMYNRHRVNRMTVVHKISTKEK